jgi:hypothetical protein
VGTGVKVGIALGVAAAWGVLWWAFDSAPAGSRRWRDQRVRLYGERQIARGWRRPSFIGLTVWVVLTVVFVVWVAGR